MDLGSETYPIFCCFLLRQSNVFRSKEREEGDFLLHMFFSSIFVVPFVGVELLSICNNNNNNNINCAGDHVIFEGVPSEAPSTDAIY